MSPFDASLLTTLAALEALERGPIRRPNPADTCECGAEATHHDYRNGHLYGLCDDCDDTYGDRR